MENKTIQENINICEEAIKNKRSVKKQCEISGISYNTFLDRLKRVKKHEGYQSKEEKKFLSIYKEAINTKSRIEETEERAKTIYVRDDNNKIIGYKYEIYIHNKQPLSGTLSRNEMQSIYQLYSYYGSSLQQRTISRQFPELSLVDFKRILRAFNITKASAPFAPHMIEEHSEEELKEIQYREKENNLLRKIEENKIKDTEKLLNKYIQENMELKTKLNNIESFKIDYPKDFSPIKVVNPIQCSDKHLILHVADLHLGASLNSGSLYKENVNYGYDEAKRRLDTIICKILDMGDDFNTIIVNLLGDNVDCCGQDGKTARLDHQMPENMDSRTQANNFISLMTEFISKLHTLCKKVKIYSVPNGNHGGNFEYMCNMTLLSLIKTTFPEIEVKLFEDFFGYYEFNDNNWIICHGKDSEFMKRGLPLNIDDKTRNMLYEWILANHISTKNLHVIKGDLHSNAINSCKYFDYRNVLSLFGASDYSNYNFSRNSYGMSYELFLGNNLTRGVFENI